MAADFQIVPGQAFFLKTQLAQQGEGGEVPGHHIGFHPVETQGAEGIVHHGGHGFGHIPLPQEILVHMVAQKTGEEHAPADLAEVHHAGDGLGRFFGEKPKPHTAACFLLAHILHQPFGLAGQGEKFLRPQRRSGAEMLLVFDVMGGDHRGQGQGRGNKMETSGLQRLYRHGQDLLCFSFIVDFPKEIVKEKQKNVDFHPTPGVTIKIIKMRDESRL